MSKNYVLAHDLGTTGNKATLYDREGRLVGSAFYGYATEHAHFGWAEQNPDDWWRAVCASTRRLLAETGAARDDIACITFSGQMMGAVPLDRQARPVAPALIWADMRAVAEEHVLAERVGRDVIYQTTGHRCGASYSLAKILWLRAHRPEVYRDAYKFVHAKDSIVARLTGSFVTDRSDASGMNLYDLAAGDWSARIVDAIGLDANKLPAVHGSTDVVGTVLPAVADEVGVAAGTPVVIGGGDGTCAATGAGAVRPGVAYTNIGSSAWIALASPTVVLDAAAKLSTYAHVVPGMLMPIGMMQAAGAAYQWVRDQLCAGERRSAGGATSVYELMNAAAQASPPGANGLIFLPYLMGERAPHWNPNARGGFIGLTIRHTHADLIRAALEGITFNLRLILDVLRQERVCVDAMRVIGGGARGRFWNQIMADAYGLPVQRLTVLEEATSMGAALAGGIGVGLYPGWELIEQMNPVAETIEPDMAAHAAYEAALPIYQAAYQALVPVYEMMAK